MRVRSAFVCLLGVVVALAVGACGSSKSGNASGGGPSSSTWTIGTVCSCSGVAAASNGGAIQVLQAWVASVNRGGGIDGHKIRLIAEDDASNATTSVTLVHQLVQQDHVIALVGSMTALMTNWAPYLQSTGIPEVGGRTADPSFLSYSNFFTIGINPVALGFALADAPVSLGDRNLGDVYCAEYVACAQVLGTMKGAAKALGAKLSVGVEINSASPDYIADCLAMKHAGVQAYLDGAISPTVAQELVDQCATQGMTGKPIATGGNITPAWLTDPATQGVIDIDYVAPWFDSAIPGVKALQSTVKNADPALYNSPQFNDGSAMAWASAMLFEDAAKAAHLGNNPTSADVMKGLYDLHNDTLGGMVQPLTYTRGQPTGTVGRCFFLITIKDHKFAAVRQTPVCMDPAKLAPLYKAAGVAQ